MVVVGTVVVVDGLVVVVDPGGGIPLVEGGSVVGGVGVSGGTPDQDQEVAEAGAAVLG